MKAAAAGLWAVFGMFVFAGPASSAATLEEVGLWEQTMSAAASLSKAGDYAGAEARFREALDLVEDFERKDPRRVHTFNSLCGVSYELGRTDVAEKYCLQALSEDNPEHATPLSRLNTLHSLHLLVAIHLQSGRTSQARKVLNRFESGFHQLEHPPAKLQGILHYDHGFLDLLDRRLDSAESNFLKAAAAFGGHPDHVNVLATTLSHLGSLCLQRKRYAQAEAHASKAVEVLTSRYGPNHPDLARDLHSLATAYLHTGRASAAEKLLLRAFPLAESAFGLEDPSVGSLSSTYAKVLKQMGRKQEAKVMQQKADAILRQAEAAHRPNRWVVDVQALANQK